MDHVIMWSLTGCVFCCCADRICHTNAEKHFAEDVVRKRWSLYQSYRLQMKSVWQKGKVISQMIYRIADCSTGVCMCVCFFKGSSVFPISTRAVMISLPEWKMAHLTSLEKKRITRDLRNVIEPNTQKTLNISDKDFPSFLKGTRSTEMDSKVLSRALNTREKLSLTGNRLHIISIQHFSYNECGFPEALAWKKCNEISNKVWRKETVGARSDKNQEKKIRLHQIICKIITLKFFFLNSILYKIN